MAIKDRIKELRTAKGWSHQRLAEEISALERLKKPLSWQTVQQWENGRSAPKTSRLQYVAQALGSSVPFLVSDTEPTEHEGSAIGGPLTVREERQSYPVTPLLSAEIAEQLARLPESAIRQIERIIATFDPSQPSLPEWRSMAYKRAMRADHEIRNDLFTNFIKAVDADYEEACAEARTATGTGTNKHRKPHEVR